MNIDRKPDSKFESKERKSDLLKLTKKIVALAIVLMATGYTPQNYIQIKSQLKKLILSTNPSPAAIYFLDSLEERPGYVLRNLNFFFDLFDEPVNDSTIENFSENNTLEMIPVSESRILYTINSDELNEQAQRVARDFRLNNRNFIFI